MAGFEIQLLGDLLPDAHQRGTVGGADLLALGDDLPGGFRTS